MKRGAAIAWILPAISFIAAAAGPPQAVIANGGVRARVYLPDPADGCYRATRFDWSGVISSVEWKEPSYFGQWFARYGPKINDGIRVPWKNSKPTGRR